MQVHQDVTLTQHVPALKKSLEKLLFRVKVCVLHRVHGDHYTTVHLSGTGPALAELGWVSYLWLVVGSV